MEFYNVKLKRKVDVAESDIKKIIYTRETKTGKTSTRYALRANYEGVNLTKFVSKDTYDQLDVPVE